MRSDTVGGLMTAVIARLQREPEPRKSREACSDDSVRWMVPSAGPSHSEPTGDITTNPPPVT